MKKIYFCYWTYNKKYYRFELTDTEDQTVYADWFCDKLIPYGRDYFNNDKHYLNSFEEFKEEIKNMCAGTNYKIISEKLITLL
jgi:hypothetical protein